MSDAQRDILRWARLQGTIRPVQAGTIIHGYRPNHAKDWHRFYSGIGCCPYAASDGSAGLKRLIARGFIVKAAPGDYRLPG